ncbi:MAG: transporter ATP-binding protein [Myxococcaceae bacterium]|nr:transporter ATP-binding protein [Myxococcaceae bacterium]
MADPIQVRIRDLRKSYGDHVVLEAVSFDIYRGAMNALVGASGCGKTVLLRQLLRLERPDAGRIELDGVDLVPLDEVALMKERHKMGVVFQDSALLDSMNVYENVALPLREHEPGLGKHAIRERVRAGLEALGVAAAIDKLPAELSGGMKKRVAVARALITHPELLIYDEPTRGLDPISARMVDRMIANTDAELHVTSLMISHDLKSVYDIADYISLLRNGKVELSAPRDAFFASKNPEVRAFLDASNIMFDAAGRGHIEAA